MDVGSPLFANRMNKAIQDGTLSKVKEGAFISRYTGVVTAVNASTNEVSVKLLGNSTASTGFKQRVGISACVNDIVVACTLGQDRWIESVVSSVTPKMAVYSDGAVRWGPGNAAMDLSLYRDATYPWLRFHSDSEAAFILETTGTSAVGIYGIKSADSNYRWILNDTGLKFGPGNAAPDVTLYRANPNVLVTDDYFVVSGGIETYASISMTGAGVGDSTAVRIFDNNHSIYLQCGDGGWFFFRNRYGTTMTTLDDQTGDVQRTNEQWYAPTFANSWVNYGSPFANAGYRKDAQGYVHLRGLIRFGTINATAFTLPAMYRPAARVLAAALSNDAIGRVEVREDGTVFIATPCNNAWVSLENITFKAEA